jgi:hypothetical protein
MLVLVPVSTAKHCFLSEAVEYAALRRLPLNCHPIVKFIPVEMAWQEREDFRWQQTVSDYVRERGLFPRYHPSGTSVPSERYKVAGLGPLYDAIGPDPKAPIDSDDSVVVSQRDEPWEKYQVFLDEYRLKVRNLLHEGKLSARGKRLPETVSVDEAEDMDLPFDSGFEPISREFWASADVRWMADCAQGRHATYKFIQILTDDLLIEFPLPDSGPASDIVQIGDNFVWVRMVDNLVWSGELSGQPVMPPAQGRPPLKWDEFHLEVAKRLKKGTLWEKQDAFINDMQAWCRDLWGREVGISTLKQKIKPYYDAFVWQKKPENDS